eukprot:1155920-Pelagomonas_calceolata.AAC.3
MPSSPPVSASTCFLPKDDGEGGASCVRWPHYTRQTAFCRGAASPRHTLIALALRSGWGAASMQLIRGVEGGCFDVVDDDDGDDAWAPFASPTPLHCIPLRLALPHCSIAECCIVLMALLPAAGPLRHSRRIDLDISTPP